MNENFLFQGILVAAVTSLAVTSLAAPSLEESDIPRANRVVRTSLERSAPHHYSVGGARVVARNESGRARSQMQQPVVSGHRGSGRNGYGPDVPENSLTGFRLAQAQGAERVELDVQVTSDGQLIVFHDPDVDRLTRGSGRLGDFVFPELRRLDLGGGERIPLLTEVHQAIDLDINYELKKLNPGATGVDSDPAQLADLLGTALAEDPIARSRIISSFDPALLGFVRERFARDGVPHAEFAFLTGGKRPPDMREALGGGWDAVHLGHFWATGRRIGRIHSAGLPVRVWTVNHPWNVRRVLNNGADGVITDDVVTARAVRDGWLRKQGR